MSHSDKVNLLDAPERLRQVGYGTAPRPIPEVRQQPNPERRTALADTLALIG